METIGFPIQFVNNEIKKHNVGTSSYYSQLIALSLQILPGELIMDDGYGVDVGLFRRPSSDEIKHKLSRLFPELLITDVDVSQNRKTTDYNINVSYEL